MEPSAEERCICQICTCGRHRCRKHPQQATLDFGPGIPSRTRGSLDHLKSSLAQTDYAVTRPTERPIIKKLVDNLQIGGGHLEANSSLKTDYPEFHPSRPVIHRLTDQLKTSSADFATTSVSQEQYRQFNVKRPEGGRKLRSSLKVRGELDAVSTNQSQYQDHENYVRPTVNRIQDKLKLAGSEALPADDYHVEDASVSNRDFRKFSVHRPVIRRLQSSLKIAPGSMEQNQSLSQETYKEMPVSRPKRHLLPDNMTSTGEMLKTSNNHDDYRNFTAERPIIKKLQDNLAVATSAKFDTLPRSTDYGEHADYSKPIRKRMEDTLKFTGEMEHASQSRQDYVEFHAERPIIKKLQDSIPVHPANGGTNGYRHTQSTQRDYGPKNDTRRPIINKLTDNLKMEGQVDLKTAYNQSYDQKQEHMRPEIKRMHSTLALATGDFVKASVVKADYPEHQVTRPTIMKPTNQLQPSSSNDASWGVGVNGGAHGGLARSMPAAGMRRMSQESFSVLGQPAGPSMNRVRQMESSIDFGSSAAAYRSNGHGPLQRHMTTTAQETYIPLEGAQKSRMTRPRTSNRLQEWNNANGEPTRFNRSRTVHAKMQSTANDSNDMMDQGTFAPRKKHQITESTLRLDQANGHDHSETCNSLYKKSFTLPAMEYCPASVLNMEEKSPYKFTREFHNHRFYKPINSNA